MNAKLIAYYRVSTAGQEQSGLGLQGQRTAVEAYARGTGASIAASFTETESGKRSDRPELAKAIAHAKRLRARLCIAKLDRLSRNVLFLATLMDGGVEFVCCDNPTATRLTLHILSAVAEHEAKQISERTRSALQAAKARGQLLGSARPGHWTGREAARLQGAKHGAEVSAKVRRERAIQGVADLVPDMQAQRQGGASFGTIARALNEAGHRTTRGNEWSAMGVKLALDRVVAVDGQKARKAS
jgi:DNA invertase Pin-like site-specific DNA recombinase